MESNNGMSPVWRQAITWTNDGLFSIRHLGTNFRAILIEVQFFFEEIAFENVICEMGAILSGPQCVNSYVNILS